MAPFDTPHSHIPREMTDAEKREVREAVKDWLSDTERERVLRFLHEIDPKVFQEFDADTQRLLNDMIAEHGPAITARRVIRWAPLRHIRLGEPGYHIHPGAEAHLKKLTEAVGTLHTALHETEDKLRVTQIRLAEAERTHVRIDEAKRAVQLLKQERDRLKTQLDANTAKIEELKARMIQEAEADPVVVEWTIAVIADIEKKIRELSDEEVVIKLQEASKNLPEELNDKRCYIAELARRVRTKGLIIQIDSLNKLHFVNAKNEKVNFLGGDVSPDVSISQENFQALMIILSLSDEEAIDNASLLTANIPNSIFDAVVAEFKLEKSIGTPWKAQDFEFDGSITTEDEAIANKKKCVEGIDAEIEKLQAANIAPATNAPQKKGNLVRIQKLTIARQFVKDRTVFSNTALAFVRDFSQDKKAFVDTFTGDARTAAGKAFDAGDTKKFLVNQAPRLVIAGLFALLAKFLPKGFREAAWAYIAAITGLGAYEDAKKAGILPSAWGGGVNGTNAPTVTSGWPSEFAESMKKILTDAPTGLESRHKLHYAHVVEKNLEIGVDRKKLDTIYLFVSQDPILWDLDADTIKGGDVDENNAFDKVSNYTKIKLQENGVKGEELKNVLRMISVVSQDGENDTKIADLFVEGQVTETENIPDTLWLSWDIFTDENKAINAHLLSISGVTYGATDFRAWSMRSKIEEALWKAQPGILTWVSQKVLEKTNFESTILVPSAESVAEVITALEDIVVEEEDKEAVNKIIEVYKGIKKGLEADEKAYNYLGEATAVYSTWGAIQDRMQDVYYWAQWLGETIPIDARTAITPEKIDELIEEGKKLRDGITDNPDLKEKIVKALEGLRKYKVKLLDDEARTVGLDPTKKAALKANADLALGAVIEANLDEYTATVEKLRAELSPLTNTYTNTEAYVTVLSEHRTELLTLARLQRLTNTGNEFQTLSKAVYSEVYTDGIEKNMTAHLEAQLAKLTAFEVDTSAITLDNIQTTQEELNKITAELIARDSFTDLMSYFDLTPDTLELEYRGDTYVNIVAGVNVIFNHIDPKYTKLDFDTVALVRKQKELDTHRIGLERDFDVKVPVPADIFTVNGIKIFVISINEKLDITKDFSDNTREPKERAIRKQISDIIDNLTARLKVHKLGDPEGKLIELSSAYDALVDWTKFWNGGNESFEELLEKKHSLIAKVKYEKKLKEMSFDDLVPESAIFLTRFKDKYYGRYSDLDIYLEALVNWSHKVSFILEQLDAIELLWTPELWRYKWATVGPSKQPQDPINIWDLRTDVKNTKSQLIKSLSGDDTFGAIHNAYWKILSLAEHLWL